MNGIRKEDKCIFHLSFKLTINLEISQYPIRYVYLSFENKKGVNYHSLINTNYLTPY